MVALPSFARVKLVAVCDPALKVELDWVTERGKLVVVPETTGGGETTAVWLRETEFGVIQVSARVKL